MGRLAEGWKAIMKFYLRDNQKEKIQVVRAIAIFMVIVTHTVLFNPYEIYIRPFVNPAVGMFIFLSGMLTKEEIQGKEILFFYKRIGLFEKNKQDKKWIKIRNLEEINEKKV